MTVQFIGMAKIQQRLGKLANPEPELKNRMQWAVETVKRSAKLNVANGHSVTGQLLSSISGRVNSTRQTVVGEVYSSVPQAFYLEFGTGQRGSDTHTPPTDTNLTFASYWIGSPAYPWLRPALESNKKAIEVLLLEGLKALMKG